MAILLKVHVTSDAKRELVERDDTAGRLDISVREPAAEGRANERVLEIIRAMYPAQSVRIINGHHAPHKLVQVGI